MTREDFTRVPWQLALSRLLMRLRRDETQTEQHVKVPVDPFRSYLNELYQQIVHVLKNTVFSEIMLSSVGTASAVTTPTRVALPVAFWRGTQGALTTGDAGPQRFRDFGTVFDAYDGRVLLLGDPGAGKTTTVLAFARDRVAARLDDIAQPLPLLAPISTWDAVRRPVLAEWPHEQVTVLDSETISSQLEAGTALVILDGLDELGRERVDQGEHFDPRRRFVSIIPRDGPVVVTCRAKDYADIDLEVALSGAVTFERT